MVNGQRLDGETNAQRRGMQPAKKENPGGNGNVLISSRKQFFSLTLCRCQATQKNYLAKANPIYMGTVLKILAINGQLFFSKN